MPAAQKTNSWQPPGNQTGIPQWLEQFLNSQGGMQGLLYQYGGIQGLIDLIQQQAQQAQASANTRPAKPSVDPLGWQAWLGKNHPDMNRKKGDPPPGWQPDPSMVQLAGFPKPPGYQPNPYYAPATGGANYLPKEFYSHYVPDAEYNALQDIPSGVTGKDLIQYLPQSLRPQGSPAQIADLQNTYNQLNAAWQADPSNIEARTQVALANQALQSAQYGPMWQAINQTTGIDDLMRKLQPQSALYRPPKPMTKWDYAAQYGYGDMSHPRTGRVFDPTQEHDFANTLQTLRAAGWDPSKGYGPQATWDPLSNGQQRSEAQQKQLNDMLYAVSPASPDYDYTAGGRLRERIAAAKEKPNLPEAPDPFVGLQAAINRDAYVNETLGGGFYGGLIPEEDAVNTFGGREIGGSHDPHFPTPQLRLDPLPGQSKYDTYAGWAADQGAAFGTAPWAVDSPYGHAMNWDDETLYQQPSAPPTAFQPTPQFGQSTWSGTKGWGNMTGKGQQQNNNAFGGTTTQQQQQQQPMSFGVSPWDNPWGMK